MPTIIYITSHDPLTFTINLNVPKFGLTTKIAEFMDSMSVTYETTEFTGVVVYAPDASEEQFDQLRDFVLSVDCHTVTIDVSYPTVGFVCVGYDSELSAFTAKASHSSTECTHLHPLEPPKTYPLTAQQSTSELLVPTQSPSPNSESLEISLK